MTAPEPRPEDSGAASLHDAIALHQQGRLEAAADLYAVLLAALPPDSPQSAELLHLFGLLRSQQNDFAAARALLERALAHGRSLKLVFSYAKCLEKLKLHAEALALFDEVIATQPDHVPAHQARAAILFETGRYQDALTSLDIVVAAKPKLVDARVARLFAGGMSCRWLPGEDEEVSALLTAAPPGMTINPFPLAFFTTSAALQRDWGDRRSSKVALMARAQPAPAVVAAPRDPAGRIRIGYLGYDFRNHAVGHIMAELFELHDRGRFDIRILSCGKDDGSAIHQRYRRIDGFTDLFGLSRPQQEAAIRAAGIDILVDLQGHTVGHFNDMLARRLAPVQVHWIGFPGTIGGGLVDYIVADHRVIPDGAEHFYVERIIRLPRCYQPNNRQRMVAKPLSRTAYGLPESGVVFCCFSRPVKIRPPLFAAWMDILRNVPGSVLWLYGPQPDAIDNLRRAAAGHGIAPERLVFAGAAQQPEYLARYRAADLMLDTYPYGSHSTGSDTLWAGCPLLTLRGETFPSRVAASLVSAAGLPQLVCESYADYGAMAIRLGNDPAALAALRRQLEETRFSMALFDTPQTTRDLEAALAMAWDLHRRGAPPQHIALPPAAG